MHEFRERYAGRGPHCVRDARSGILCVLRPAHRDPAGATRQTGRRTPAKADREQAPDEACSVHEGFAPFVVRPGRDHFKGPSGLRRASPHHAAGVRSARTGRTDDLKFRVVESLVLEKGIRAIWAVQDKLTLNADEEKVIELVRELVSGQERTVWNQSLSIPVRDFEFADAEAGRIKAAIETWDLYSAAADRRWLEPLVEALFSTEMTSCCKRSTANT